MSRSGAVVTVADLAGEPRPRFTQTPGVAAIVRSPGQAVGLTRMAVHQRIVAPGFAGTNRHFHTVEEEWTFVLSGHGKLRIGPLQLAIKPGDFAGFPPGPRPHHFINDGNEDLVLLEGGESRAEEDGCWYPDARLMSQGRKVIEPYREPPPEEGNAEQLRQLDALAPKSFQHDVESQARRQMRALHKGTGLERQAVYWCRVARGDLSTAMHTHDRTEEWVYILSGKAVAHIGDNRRRIGPDDFVGYPAGGQPHYMEAVTDLTYLMGGMIDAGDVVTYPRHGVRRIGGTLAPLPGRPESQQ